MQHYPNILGTAIRASCAFPAICLWHDVQLQFHLELYSCAYVCCTACLLWVYLCCTFVVIAAVVVPTCELLHVVVMLNLGVLFHVVLLTVIVELTA